MTGPTPGPSERIDHIMEKTVLIGDLNKPEDIASETFSLLMKTRGMLMMIIEKLMRMIKRMLMMMIEMLMMMTCLRSCDRCFCPSDRMGGPLTLHL